MKRSGSDDYDEPANKTSRESSSVLVRFLIPRRAAGLMIGKGGENIKKLKAQYNVRVDIPPCESPERIMTCEGDLQSICDAILECSSKLKDVLNAKSSDPKRIMGYYSRKPRNETDEEENEDNMLDYRILVHQSQAGAVIGRGGDRIKELRRDAPPRGRRADYDVSNFDLADAFNYGGWLSDEAIQSYPHGGMPPQQHGFRRESYGNGANYAPPRGMYPKGGDRGRFSRVRGPSVDQTQSNYGSFGSGYGGGADMSGVYGDGYNYMTDPTAYPGPMGPGGYDSSVPSRGGSYAGWGTTLPPGQDVSKANQWSGGWS